MPRKRYKFWVSFIMVAGVLLLSSLSSVWFHPQPISTSPLARAWSSWPGSDTKSVIM